VGGLINRAESLLAHVSVQLGRRKIGVTQQFLYGAEVCAPVEKVGGVGVAQSVGMGRTGGPAVENAANVTGSEAMAPPVQEEGFTG
jgi:hypothetical protein